MSETTHPQRRSTEGELAHSPGSSSRFLRDLPGKLWRRFGRYYRRYFQNRNHVFVRRGPFPPEHRSDCTFVRYERFDDLPAAMRETIINHGGQRSMETDQREMSEDAVLWAALIDSNLAGTLFTRPGRLYRHWFVPLDAEDLIIFRVRTFPEFRGRGVAPSLMRHAMAESLTESDRAYIDCRVYNKPSIRSIEKAGFQLLTTMKPITRQQALASDTDHARAE